MARNKKAQKDITIVDVAREAGVSFATVSRVINNTTPVSPEKHERVVQAMNRLGYVVNQQARSLAGGRTSVIGVLVPNVGTAYIEEIMVGVNDALEASQYELLLYTTHRQRENESTYFMTLTRGLADGLLLILPRHVDLYSRTLHQRQFPHVLIDAVAPDENSPAVVATNRDGLYDATRHLIELGHRRIAFIAGPDILSTCLARMDGYRQALHDYQLPFDPALCHKTIGDAYIKPHYGYNVAMELFDLPDPPTAIVGYNDLMAIGVLDAAIARGIRVPEECSIVGFDDILQAQFTHPPLTTVHHPLQDMGRIATQMLIEQIQDPEKNLESMYLPTNLVIRNTTAPPPQR